MERSILLCTGACSLSQKTTTLHWRMKAFVVATSRTFYCHCNKSMKTCHSNEFVNAGNINVNHILAAIPFEPGWIAGCDNEP
ncbi:hypothetical protein LZ31DRAFT_300273 [Colletotrichum somersetense]|nr:hypothetical protein LZ31DRAFT_300273 [Colletotrichum somersetense]